jgi:NDP-sugar pyrophosphorylase family protein
MNILILAAGQNQADTRDAGYPLCLTEIKGVSLLEKLITSCSELPDAHFIFALQEEDIKRWHIDGIVYLLDPQSIIVRVQRQTGGAACTAMLASSYIDNDDELLIINATDLLDVDFSEVLVDFRHRGLDGGTVVFPSVHPRYSFVRVDENGWVVEAAEKTPISRLATAGVYWFAHGSSFIRAAKKMIEKNAHVGGYFYVCPVFNQMILDQGRIGIFPIVANRYHPLKSEHQLQQYEISRESGGPT